MEIVVSGKRQEVAPGSHICQLYNQPGEALDVSVSLLRNGLASEDRCFWAGPEQSAVEVQAALEHALAKAKRSPAPGQLTFITEKDALLNGGRFDAYHLVSAHQTFIAQSVKDGWRLVRGVVDMTWLTRGIASSQDILKYEAACDAVFTFQNAPIVAVFQYDYSRLSGAVVVELLKLHPIAIVGNFIKRNPYYLNSEEYLKKILQIDRERRRQPL
ncbi:MAG: MEDS domain-containing protein [Chloroflexi bacterium]|nr:MEDS domain-containing protein [Chloroflexota bacterium]